jgi:hypothetical protein
MPIYSSTSVVAAFVVFSAILSGCTGINQNELEAQTQAAPAHNLGFRPPYQKSRRVQSSYRQICL